VKIYLGVEKGFSSLHGDRFSLLGVPSSTSDEVAIGALGASRITRSGAVAANLS
jgi:hypothetical protein